MYSVRHNFQRVTNEGEKGCVHVPLVVAVFSVRVTMNFE
jgi:hypothetical protein